MIGPLANGFRHARETLERDAIRRGNVAVVETCPGKGFVGFDTEGGHGVGPPAKRFGLYCRLAHGYSLYDSRNAIPDLDRSVTQPRHSKLSETVIGLILSIKSGACFDRECHLASPAK
jgi:hypothetical protein